MLWVTFLLLLCASLTRQKQMDDGSPHLSDDIYFLESFESGFFDGDWVRSEAKKEENGEMMLKYEGEWAIELPQDRRLPRNNGLVLKSPAKLHAIASSMRRVFHFKDKPLIVQYEVHFQDGVDCGGAYIKLLSHRDDLDLTQFHDKTPFSIMFGPDRCGKDYKMHFIFRHRNPFTGLYEEKHAKKPSADLNEYFTSQQSHLYSLVLYPDNHFKILIDQSVINEGSLLKDMSPPVIPPKEIEDPEDTKPEDWDDRIQIPDPNTHKPLDWDDDAPRWMPDPTAVKPLGWLDAEDPFISDPDAEKPEDWDDSMDGNWEAPLIPNPVCTVAPGCGEWTAPTILNPAYKGKWKPPMIPNPNYQGLWKPRMIPNPDYFEDPHPFRMDAIGAVGLELWSLTPNIFFDNLLVCSDEKVAEQWTANMWEKKQPGIFSKLLAAAGKRPWLWGLYVFTVALPVVLFISICWPDKRFGPPDQDYYYKKTDDPQPDDPVDPERNSSAQAFSRRKDGCT
ncbi:calnexin-like [Polypterus senegalus]|uniref:calnexin-like n=1 Tax=Polypterus senegalus TaxID=55291 RepID=UPI0019650226|nr:calnexin-like [Polypterus senegalus]